MDFICEEKTNESLREESLHLLRQTFPGYWVVLIVGLVGVVNNGILFLVAHRLRWFQQPQYTLIIAQIGHDTLLAILIIVQALYQISYTFSSGPELFTQLQCVGWCIPAEFGQDLDQKTSMVIAIDRVYSAVAPHHWASLGYTYRLCMLAVVYLWSILEEIGWFPFVVQDTCVKVCLVSAFPDGWYSTLELTADTIASSVIIVSYLLLPTLSGSYIRRLNCSYLVVMIDDMEQRQQTMVRRVRTLSLLTIVSFLVTTFFGFTFCDLLESTFSGYFTNSQIAFIDPFLLALCCANIMLPLPLFMWRDESIREQVRQLLTCGGIKGLEKKDNNKNNDIAVA